MRPFGHKPPEFSPVEVSMTRHTATASRTAVRICAAGLVAACLTAGGFAARAQPKTPAAQTAPAQSPMPKPTTPATADDKSDPVVAKVGSDVIHLSELNAAVESLPPQARAQMTRDQLLPKLLEQIVDTRALALEARKQGLEKDPKVVRTMHDAEDRTLVAALLEREIGPKVTDAAVKERFDKDIASKPPVQEVHARHILVDDEATAKKIIAELKKGGDFAALSKQYSKDAAAVEQGGDLGYFKATDMVPEFSAAAFALKDNEISPQPVHTQFGWHVIQTLDHRAAAAPTFDQVKDQLRQQMINEEVRKVLAQARTDVTVQTFNPDGSQPRATDQAVPPPAPSK
jgi:peptidyl-prolyl cis-trans isomerase C